MASSLPMRLANWLTAILVALWPAAAAQACCCSAGPALTEGGCQSGCCAARTAAESCCHEVTGQHDGTCCATSQEREACACGHDCGQGDSRAKQVGALDKTGASPLPALADGWLPATGPESCDLAAIAEGGAFPTRPKRILYGVWRN
jgi:hypothetical protein